MNDTSPSLKTAQNCFHSYLRQFRGVTCLTTLPPHFGSAPGSQPLLPHLKPWHPMFFLDSNSRHQHSIRAFPLYLLILSRTPTICRQMQALGGREHSMDRLYNATQPPPKRLRANTEEQRPREPTGTPCIDSTHHLNINQRRRNVILRGPHQLTTATGRIQVI